MQRGSRAARYGRMENPRKPVWNNSSPRIPSGGVSEAVRIRMLGGFSVSVGAVSLEKREWRLRKAAGLVKLLALEPGHRMHREQLMEVLWPELDEKAQANNLRYALHHARRTLALASDPDTASRLLALRGELIELGTQESFSVDVEAFEEAARTARG